MTKEERDRLRGLHAEVVGHTKPFGGFDGAPVSGPELSIEAHGNGEAIYVGRGRNAHGLNVAYVTEPAYQWPNVRALIVTGVNALPALLTTLDEYEEENARLREALEEYGEHAIKCLYRLDAYRGALNPRGCDCGYDAALQGKPRVKP